MSHLKNISFNNYRIFETHAEFDLRPLTFLTGPNSSGKSSVLKSILLSGQSPLREEKSYYIKPWMGLKEILKAF